MKQIQGKQGLVQDIARFGKSWDSTVSLIVKQSIATITEARFTENNSALKIAFTAL